MESPSLSGLAAVHEEGDAPGRLTGVVGGGVVGRGAVQRTHESRVTSQHPRDLVT